MRNYEKKLCTRLLHRNNKLPIENNRKHPLWNLQNPCDVFPSVTFASYVTLVHTFLWIKEVRKMHYSIITTEKLKQQGLCADQQPGGGEKTSHCIPKILKLCLAVGCNNRVQLFVPKNITKQVTTIRPPPRKFFKNTLVTIILPVECSPDYFCWCSNAQMQILE